MSIRAWVCAATLVAPVLGADVLFPSTALAADDPMGSLVRSVFGDSLEREHGIKVYGWAQVGAIYNNNGTDDVSKQSFFNTDEGVNLNQFALAVEKKPKSNVIGRVGPFPGAMPQEADWGFNVTALYGKDARFFKTYGWDEDLSVNRDNKPEDPGVHRRPGLRQLLLPGARRFGADDRDFPHAAGKRNRLRLAIPGTD